jgi:deoxyribonucleoside regulator
MVQVLEGADAIVFGIGTVVQGRPSSPYVHGSFLSDKDFSELEADGAVGDIATTFFRADGSSDGIRLNARTSGPDLDKVRAIQHRICVVSGNHKIPALHAALRGRLISQLVIDELTAKALVDFHSEARD